MNLPASDTKHVKSLPYTLPSGKVVTLSQDDSLGDSTGRSLWLGAQLLVLYLDEILQKDKIVTKGKDGLHRRKRCIELGAGTGLVSIFLHSKGYDVLATDIPFIAHSSLITNLEKNRFLSYVSETVDSPRLQAAGLDWTSPANEWEFLASNGDITPRPEEQRSIAVVSERESPIAPPFDYILLSDVLYSTALVQPLINTLTGIALLSPTSKTYLAVEIRDVELIRGFFERAKEMDWKCSKVNDERLQKLMMNKGWDVDGWEGVEVWCLKRRKT